MIKTFQYRIYPTNPQRKAMEQTIETCRSFYNDCLAERKNAYEERGESIGKYAQLRKVKDLKASDPFAKVIHSHVLQIVVTDLDKAFQAFFRRVKAGETPGYPRFKGKDRFDSFGYKEYGNGFKLDGRRYVSPGSAGSLFAGIAPWKERSIPCGSVVKQENGMPHSPARWKKDLCRDR